MTREVYRYRICQEKLGWKKSTTYTVIKKLEEKGVLRRERAIVVTLVDRDQIVRQESEELLKKAGSLPAFFAAFLKDRKLTLEETQRIRNMIEEACADGGVDLRLHFIRSSLSPAIHKMEKKAGMRGKNTGRLL